MKSLTIEGFAQIEHAHIDFADLTLLVGPQATGKSLFLQWAKLAFDAADVLHDFDQYGLRWKDRSTRGGDPTTSEATSQYGRFCDLYFGDGYAAAFHDSKTKIIVDGNVRSLDSLLRSRRSKSSGDVYYIPAHRSLLMADGWPRPFQQYFGDTPYVARKCSERLRRLLTTSGAAKGEQLFPQRRRFKEPLRQAIDSAVFHGAPLKQGIANNRQRLLIAPKGYRGTGIPYMAWTAGQREFAPMLLSMYDLIPPTNRARIDPFRYIILEEPEMGLHPNAIMVSLMMVLELLSRGYKVILSTHSPIILAAVWCVGELQRNGAKKAKYLKLFGMPNALGGLADAAKQMTTATYYFHFNKDTVTTQDISDLDPASTTEAESGWGGLTGAVDRMMNAVASR